MNSNELLNLAAKELRQGNIPEAYNILISNRDSYIKDIKLYYFSITLACQLKKVEDAIKFLNEAVLTLEMWFNTDFLDRDPNLDLIRDLETYKSIYNICKKRQEDLKYSGEKFIDVYIPEVSSDKLFLMIPDNYQSINEVKTSFNKDSVKDYIIAIPQSREFHSYLEHIWENIEFGLNVVLEHYNDLLKEHDINKNEVIISSFAAGGNVAFKALVDNTLPAKKYIFFAPIISNLELFDHQIKDFTDRDIKIFIICGKNDPHYLPASNQFDETLTKHGVNHKYLILDDLDHSFPKNMDEIINKAIEYFNN